MEINKLIAPYGLQIGLNSSKKHHLTKTPDGHPKKQPLLALKMSTRCLRSNSVAGVRDTDCGVVITEMNSVPANTDTVSVSCENSTTVNSATPDVRDDMYNVDLFTIFVTCKLIVNV